MISPNKFTKSRLKIGLFTDTYRPTVNGISVVVDTLRRQLEAAGHEVIIVCPATPAARKVLKHETNIITVPSIKGWPYREYDISFFWPPSFRKRLLQEDFDAIMFFTPGQLGIMAMNVASQGGIPIIAQHSTDLVEYVVRYMGGPAAALFVLCGLWWAAPRGGVSATAVWSALRPRLSYPIWGRQIIHQGLGLWYSLISGVVALSRKSKSQIVALPYVRPSNVRMVPVGVDPLPKQARRPFREQYNIPDTSPLLMYVGRISREKNLDIILPMMEQIIRDEPAARFAFVGDFDYRKKLQQKVRALQLSKHIIFTGKIAREELADVYAAADMFIFPSTTDTQGLVVHEAALAGLPIIMTDGDVTEVVKTGVNGYIVANTARAFAEAALELIKDTALRHRFAEASVRLASEYSEAVQTRKLLGYIQTSTED